MDGMIMKYFLRSTGKKKAAGWLTFIFFEYFTLSETDSLPLKVNGWKMKFPFGARRID